MSLVDYQVQSGVAVLTLNQAPANTYSYEMMQELDAATLKARMDRGVSVIVLTGAGERFFCAGADIRMLQEADPEFKYYFCLHANETLRRLEETPKLTIAALNGHTVGGGLEVAMACDLRIARRGAGKLGLPEVKLGVLPGTGGTQRLSALIGRSRALQLMIEAETLDMDAGQAIGLVHHVYDADDSAGFLSQVLKYASGFVPPNAPARAVGAIKRAVQTGSFLPLDSGLALERELQAQLFASQDAKEGISAYNEKRKAEFRGE